MYLRRRTALIDWWGWDLMASSSEREKSSLDRVASEIDTGAEHHKAWMERLLNYLARPDGSLSVSIVRSDSNCELGKWLLGEGSRFAGTREFEGLRLEHARFHRLAARVVELAEQGKSADDARVVEALESLNAASGSIIKALAALKSLITQPRP